MYILPTNVGNAGQREKTMNEKRLFSDRTFYDSPHLDAIVIDFGKVDENENNYYFWSLDGVTKHRNKWLQKH